MSLGCPYCGSNHFTDYFYYISYDPIRGYNECSECGLYCEYHEDENAEVFELPDTKETKPNRYDVRLD